VSKLRCEGLLQNDGVATLLGHGERWLGTGRPLVDGDGGAGEGDIRNRRRPSVVRTAPLLAGDRPRFGGVHAEGETAVLHVTRRNRLSTGDRDDTGVLSGSKITAWTCAGHSWHAARTQLNEAVGVTQPRNAAGRTQCRALVRKGWVANEMGVGREDYGHG